MRTAIIDHTKEPQKLTNTLRDLVVDAGRLSQAGAETEETELSWWCQTLESTCKAQIAELETFLPWVAMPAMPDTLRQRAESDKAGGLNELAGMFSWLRHIPTLRDAARFEQTLIPLVILVTEKMREQRAPECDIKWLEELQTRAREAAQRASQRLSALNLLAQRCSEFAEMDFEFLFDKKDRKSVV